MGGLRLATACAGLNKRSLVAAIVEANWKSLKQRKGKKNIKKAKRRGDLSAPGELTPEQIGRIKESVQEAFQDVGLGSTMVNIRTHVSERLGIDCCQGAALQTCDKAILRLLRKRQKLARRLPSRPLPRFVKQEVAQEVADLRREQAAMLMADAESQAYGRC